MTDRQQESIDKLEAQVSSDPGLSPEDRELLHELLTFFRNDKELLMECVKMIRGAKGVGAILKVTLFILGTVVGIIVAWDKLAERFLS